MPPHQGFAGVRGRYAEILTPSDFDALGQDNLKPQSYAITETERRRLRALGVIQDAKAMLEKAKRASPSRSVRKHG